MRERERAREEIISSFLASFNFEMIPKHLYLFVGITVRWLVG